MDKKYLEHKIFLELSTYMDFYDSLSDSVMSFVTSGVKDAENLDTHIFRSILGTLDSIKLILSNGRINDAYALLRKYHDSAIINAYEIAYLQENISVDNFIVERINSWLTDTSYQLPRYENMIDYLSKVPALQDINILLKKDRRYEEIRKSCNNHMHYNFFYYMLINDNEIYDRNRLKFLDQLSDDLRNIFILHFCYLFTLNPQYMTASDYMDALEAGLEPEKDSQYFVAPFIQDSFITIVSSYRSDLAAILKTNSGMQL